MKPVIGDMFATVLEYLVGSGHVKLENYFVDGTTIEANANKHKVVWEKRRDKYNQRVKEQIKELLIIIEQENEAEQEKYEDEDLEEMGGIGEGCALKKQCTKAKGNRQIRISFQLLDYRRQARNNLTTEFGQQLRSESSTDVETGFGCIKHNMGFRRFYLRGIEKVNIEWGLVSIAHNMRKLATT